MHHPMRHTIKVGFARSLARCMIQTLSAVAAVGLLILALRLVYAAAGNPAVFACMVVVTCVLLVCDFFARRSN